MFKYKKLELNYEDNNFESDLNGYGEQGWRIISTFIPTNTHGYSRVIVILEKEKKRK